jgi:N-acetylneuraminate synthase
MKAIKIGNRVIGKMWPVYIVAELSANHNGSYDQAVRVIEASKAAGADAIKVQTYTADTLTIDSAKEYFRVGKGSLWEGRTLYDLYQEASMPWEWQPKLKNIAEKLGLDFFSTPFDSTAIEFLEKMDVPVYKIASFEVVDLPLIQLIARTGKPLIMSTGISTEQEIQDAVNAFRSNGGNDIILLKCTSAYPARPEEMNLRAIRYLEEKFDVVAGLSDHSMDPVVPVAAVAMGACIIEKHFTISRSIPGPDSAFSLEPPEFAAMVQAIRTTEKALGNGTIEITESEQASRVFRRSLFIIKDMVAGDIFSGENVRSIRPGYGLPPSCLYDILGKRSTCDLPAGTPLRMEHVK